MMNLVRLPVLYPYPSAHSIDPSLRSALRILQMELSINHAARALAELRTKKPTSATNKHIDEFEAAVTEMKRENGGHAVHPKMELTRTILMDHFSGKDVDPAIDISTTKVMVFISFKETLNEVVEYLNKESPLIRATAFVGQGNSKSGLGMKRTTQDKVCPVYLHSLSTASKLI